jgi:hypothetical protein
MATRRSGEWLHVADARLRKRRPEDSWIKESYNQAMASAFASDRAKARQMLRRWLEPLRSRCGEPTPR